MTGFMDARDEYYFGLDLLNENEFLFKNKELMDEKVLLFLNKFCSKKYALNFKIGIEVLRDSVFIDFHTIPNKEVAVHIFISDELICGLENRYCFFYPYIKKDIIGIGFDSMERTIKRIETFLNVNAKEYLNV